MRKKILVLALLFSCTAQAKNLKIKLDGDDAEEMSFILKNMPKVVKSNTKTEYLFSFKNVRCAKTQRAVEEDGLPGYSCSKPDLSNGVVAREVFEAFKAAGANTDAAMNHEYVQVKNVNCIVSRDKVTGDSHCEFTDEFGSRETADKN